MLKLTLLLVLFSINEYINCGEVNLLDSISIKWEPQGTQTKFWITASLPASIASDTSNAWISVGINVVKEMDDLNCVVCNITNQGSGMGSVVSHYASKKMDPVAFDKDKLDVGLNNAAMSHVSNEKGGQTVTCEFKRDNMKPDGLTLPEGTRYLEIGPDSKFYVLVAFGAGDFSYHGSNRAITETAQDFGAGNANSTGSNSNNNSNSSSFLSMVKQVFDSVIQFFKSMFNKIFNRN